MSGTSDLFNGHFNGRRGCITRFVLQNVRHDWYNVKTLTVTLMGMVRVMLYYYIIKQFQYDGPSLPCESRYSLATSFKSTNIMLISIGNDSCQVRSAYVTDSSKVRLWIKKMNARLYRDKIGRTL